jgi:Recombination endonuclease VII
MGESKKAKYDREYYLKNRKRFLKRSKRYRRKFAKQVLAAQRKWYNSVGKPIKRASWLLSKYGLTVERYSRIFKKQQGRCALCQSKEFGGRWGSPNVDHKESEVRGILCSMCNLTLGFLELKPNLLKRCKPFWKYVQNPPARGIK